MAPRRPKTSAGAGKLVSVKHTGWPHRPIGLPRALSGATGRIACKRHQGKLMLRWLIVVFLALIIFSGLQKWLQKFGFGRLPGDFRFRLFGREFFLPVTSTLLLSMIAAAIARWV